MTGVGDRRPWLIISRREAIALQLAALRCAGEVSPDLARALRVVDLQLRYISGGADGEIPNVTATLLREERSGG